MLGIVLAKAVAMVRRIPSSRVALRAALTRQFPVVRWVQVPLIPPVRREVVLLNVNRVKVAHIGLAIRRALLQAVTIALLVVNRAEGVALL